MGKVRRVFLGADTHCGSNVGLMPPAPTSGDRWQTSDEQTELWDLFEQGIDEVGPFDVAVWDGDLIDGKGLRQGGREIVLPDRMDQVLAAAECIKRVGCSRNYIARGTPYHTGASEKWEDLLVCQPGTNVKAIKNHLYINIAGVLFDVKHKIGSSSIPHGQSTSLNRARSWNLEWAVNGVVPICSVFVRAHTHHYTMTDMATCRLYKLPALQGLGTEYGTLQCEQTVHWGFCYVDVLDGEIVGGGRWLAPGSIQAVEVEVVKFDDEILV